MRSWMREQNKIKTIEKLYVFNEKSKWYIIILYFTIWYRYKLNLRYTSAFISHLIYTKIKEKDKWDVISSGEGVMTVEIHRLLLHWLNVMMEVHIFHLSSCRITKEQKPRNRSHNKPTLWGDEENISVLRSTVEGKRGRRRPHVHPGIHLAPYITMWSRSACIPLIALCSRGSPTALLGKQEGALWAKFC